MMRFPRLIHHLARLTRTLSTRVVGGWRYLLLCLRPSPTRAAASLLLRTQLALYRECGITPRRLTHATRLTLVWLAHGCDWRQAVTVVQPATFIHWRGADRQRTTPQAWPVCVTADRAAVSAHAPGPWMASTRPLSALADRCAPPCPGDGRR
jgi:hypothetical protein